MIRLRDKKWTKLRLAYSDPSAIPDALKDLISDLFRRRSDIKGRIAEQQKRTYGERASLTVKKVAACKYTAEEERRIEYYLGNAGRENGSLDKSTPEFDPCRKPHMLMIADYDFILKASTSNRLMDGYTLPLLNLFNLLPETHKKRKFLYRPGDHSKKSPYNSVLAKTRQCDDRAVTLLKLNPVRNWKQVKDVQSNDLAYRDKKNIAVWRGATTGHKKTWGKRADLVELFSDHKHRFDVGFSIVTREKSPRGYSVKDIKSLKELLQYKFLICLEGNDVASGLKWMLHSNSVVMMPRPATSGWLMEDALKPFVHYIPLADDFSDAEERFNWAVSHEAECIEISNNASQHMSQFLDPRKEILLECEVFRRYLDHLEVS